MALLEHTGHPGLTVEVGDVVGILGAPGSGKTRLAMELAFLERPLRGEVLLRGENPLVRRSRFSMPRRPRDVTVLVQNAEEQLFARSVFDDVAFGPRRYRLAEDEVRDRVMNALTTVGLDADEVADRSPFALSGGERRRVALAGLLAMEPQVLVLDEPTANLDAHTRAEFLGLLGPLRDRSAIIWLTSSAREASMTSRIYLLQNGETEVVGGGASLFHDWRSLEDAGIELPDVYELARALEHRGLSLPDTDSPSTLVRAIAERLKEREGAR